MPVIAGRTALLVIDEAHCISDWGHDFRPDYQRIARLVAQLPPNAAILATTATANDRVIRDIERQVGVLPTYRGSLNRENLALHVLPVWGDAQRLAWLAEHLPAFVGQGIVYALTTSDVELVATWLNRHGIRSAPYHGDSSSKGRVDTRVELEALFESGEIRVLVATTALALGYDNPNVTFVVHYQTPGSLIAYYQQVGRAGRRHDAALGILMSGARDERINEHFRTKSLPNERDIRRLLGVLETVESARIVDIARTLNMGSHLVKRLLKYLEVQQPATVASNGEFWVRNPVPISPELWTHPYEVLRVREHEWEEIQLYRSMRKGCRMQALLIGLDQEGDSLERCGKCDLCVGAQFDTVNSPELVDAAVDFLKHPEGVRIEPRREIPPSAFAIYTFSGVVAARDRIAPGRAMVRYGTAGLGERIQREKASGRFNEDLVTAAVAMIRDEWNPRPAPEWVTAVPSRRNPGLVADLAGRIGAELGLPYHPVVAKVLDTEPQKSQQEELHQCRNLDGVFDIVGDVDRRPVLLIDDIVDSGWTFAVIGMLLRRAGSGVVHPFALASSQSRGA